MFDWLKRLFRREHDVDSYDLYKPKKRNIFKFFNGKEIVQGDPMVIYKRIMEVGPELHISLRVADSPSKDAVQAHTDAVVSIRKIFGLDAPKDPLRAADEGCLEEPEVIDLLDRFLLYKETVKKNSPNSVIPAREISPASAPSSAANPVSSSSSGSGSTEGEPSTKPPIPPTTAPVPPTAPSTPT